MGPLLLLELSSAAALAAPTITAIDPASGPTAGQTAITITGTDFVAGLTVDFDGLPATGIVLTGSTSIACLNPAHAAGLVLVTVTNPDTQFATIAFTYVAPVSPPDVTPPAPVPPPTPVPPPAPTIPLIPAATAVGRPGVLVAPVGGPARQRDVYRVPRQAGWAQIHGERLELRIGHVSARGRTIAVVEPVTSLGVAGQARIGRFPKVTLTVGHVQGTGGAHVRIARMPGGRRHGDVVTDAALEAWLLLQI